MNLSEYIKELQHMLEDEGDLVVVYSVDSEGNDFHKVDFTPSVLYFEDLNSYYLERADEEELDEYENPVKAICIN